MTSRSDSNIFFVGESGTPAKMSNMELPLDLISVDQLDGFLRRNMVPKPCNMLFDGHYQRFWTAESLGALARLEKTQ